MQEFKVSAIMQANKDFFLLGKHSPRTVQSYKIYSQKCNKIRKNSPFNSKKPIFPIKINIM